jgi:uncharacterized membrane protein (UPF0127 family)
MVMPRSYVRFAATLLALWLVTTTGIAWAQSVEPLVIVTKDGARKTFQVEVARNEADRAQGLMFRRAMPADHGIRADGTIARIAANTEPLSTRTIASGEPVLAVLELNAGTASRLGIKVGDRVEHMLFKH